MHLCLFAHKHVTKHPSTSVIYYYNGIRLRFIQSSEVASSLHFSLFDFLAIMIYRNLLSCTPALSALHSITLSDLSEPVISLSFSLSFISTKLISLTSYFRSPPPGAPLISSSLHSRRSFSSSGTHFSSDSRLRNSHARICCSRVAFPSFFQPLLL